MAPRMARKRRQSDLTTRRPYPLRRKRSPEMFRVIEKIPSLAWLGAALSPPICKQAVSRWTRVPSERVREVSALTGIPAYELRPDMYDPPPARKRR